MPRSSKRHVPPQCVSGFKSREGDTAEAHSFYSSYAWREFRRGYLQRHPLCVRCKVQGLIVVATEVHHTESRLEHPEFTYDEDKLEGLCKPCHSSHTMAERNARRRGETAKMAK